MGSFKNFNSIITNSANNKYGRIKSKKIGINNSSRNNEKFTTAFLE